jgi:hypothetical protein
MSPLKLNNQNMRFFTLLLLALTTVLTYTSCQKEVSGEVDSSNNPSTSGTFKAKINGTQWTATKSAGAARVAGLISIAGIGNDKKYLAITLTDSGAHKYVISDETMNFAVLIDSSETDPSPYVSILVDYTTHPGGEVNITSIDTAKKTMSGTFSFKLNKASGGIQKTITEGSFTLPYTTSMPQAATTDTFRVKINNTAWTPHAISGTSSFGQIAINASNSAATKNVGLIFPSNITPGSYDLDFWGATYIGQYNPDLDPMHSQASMSGTLTILEHNTATRRVRGNFAFRGEEMMDSTHFTNLSEGYFSVKY